MKVVASKRPSSTNIQVNLSLINALLRRVYGIIEAGFLPSAPCQRLSSTLADAKKYRRSQGSRQTTTTSGSLLIARISSTPLDS